MSLKLISPVYFYLFNVATRKHKMTYVSSFYFCWTVLKYTLIFKENKPIAPPT